MNPGDQNARERQLRYDRRNRSPIPMSRMELAEHRHHHIVRLWQNVFAWGPIILAVAVQVAFGGIWAAAIVVCFARFAALAMVALVLLMVKGLFSTGYRTWMGVNKVASLVAGVAAAGLGYFGAISTGAPASEVWVAIVGGGLLAIWPWLYEAVRSNHHTDYERMVWAARTRRPRRIIE